jgi:hypothetical protein
MSKLILCLDFDGVCHSYTSGWKGAEVIPDDAVPGLFEFLEKAEPYFNIQVFSSRSNHPGGIDAMREWLKDQHKKWCLERGLEKKFPSVSFPSQKPSAFVTLDDRAITFTGQWPDIDYLRKFKPWYKVAGNNGS